MQLSVWISLKNLIYCTKKHSKLLSKEIKNYVLIYNYYYQIKFEHDSSSIYCKINLCMSSRPLIHVWIDSFCILHTFFFFFTLNVHTQKTCVVLNWMTLISIYVVPFSIFPLLWMCVEYLGDGPKMLAIKFKPNSHEANYDWKLFTSGSKIIF